MNISKALLFLVLLVISCTSFDVEKISLDICACSAELVKVNAAIEKVVQQGTTEKVTALFIQAGKIHEQTKTCILGLSSIYGTPSKKQFQSIRVDLQVKCMDALEAFDKSGWRPIPLNEK